MIRVSACIQSRTAWQRLTAFGDLIPLCWTQLSLFRMQSSAHGYVLEQNACRVQNVSSADASATRYLRVTAGRAGGGCQGTKHASTYSCFNETPLSSSNMYSPQGESKHHQASAEAAAAAANVAATVQAATVAAAHTFGHSFTGFRSRSEMSRESGDGRTTRRQWESAWQRQESSRRAGYSGGWHFKVMSYNVLSPTLLSANMELYSHCDQACLDWDYRKLSLLKEIIGAHCDIVCLQEVDEADYESFFRPQLAAAGFRGSYQKRRGDKTDGCATFFDQQKFILEQESKLCYFVENGSILDRDNVAIVVRLLPKASAPPRLPSVCIANTHLLFNPRRGDVKLAQTAMLLAELDRLASVSDVVVGTSGSSHRCEAYCPTIICGDFNMTPHCPIYKLLLCKELLYEGLDCASLSGQYEGRSKSRGGRELSSDLIPLRARVSSSCRYVTDEEALLLKQQQRLGSSGLTGSAVTLRASKSALRGLSGRDSPAAAAAAPLGDGGAGSSNGEQLLKKPRPAAGGRSRDTEEGSSPKAAAAASTPPIASAPVAETRGDDAAKGMSQSRGRLTHGFDLVSTYRHVITRYAEMSYRDRRPPIKVKEITTQHQYAACTVDYIFYTVDSKSVEMTPNGSLYLSQVKEGPLKLIGRYGLLCEDKLVAAGGLPNAAMPSDHLPLVAHFALESR